jgi:hypothetical protein
MSIRPALTTGGSLALGAVQSGEEFLFWDDRTFYGEMGVA